jgi:hypothetical protein
VLRASSVDILADSEAAGLAARDPVKQACVLDLLEKTLEITRFPPKSLLADLTNQWHTQR